jgi:hypothetical protein
VLLGISMVMISLIVFILRHLKIICRSLGIVFILIGTLSGASLLILKNIADPEMFSYGIIPQLQTWAPLVVRDISFPMALFGISFGAVGAILLAVSFIRIKPVRVE